MRVGASVFPPEYFGVAVSNTTRILESQMGMTQSLLSCRMFSKTMYHNYKCKILFKDLPFIFF